MTTTTSPVRPPVADHPLVRAVLERGPASLIGGSWKAANGATDEVRNPSDRREVIGTFALAGATEVEAAVEAARSAQAAWAATPAPERARILREGLDVLRREAETLAALVAWEGGKLLAEARIEVSRGLNAMDFLIGEGRRLAGVSVPSEVPGMFVTTRRRPVGIVGAITPWNFPFAIPAWKIVPALVTGNPVVLKPAEQTPFTASLLADVLTAAGLPPGVLNLVTGDGVAGRALVEHAEVRAISFTGSTDVGRTIPPVVAGRLGKVQLEMGGKNAALVLDDADLPAAADAIAMGAWGSCGQRCTATSRVLVPRTLHDALAALLVERASGLAMGPALDPASRLGPLIEAAARDRVAAMVDEARAAGATCLVGGEIPGGPLAHGHHYPATLLGQVTGEMRLARQEVFGPVLALMPYDTVEEAIALANDVRYGLSSSVFTRDLSRAFQVANALETGLQHVNCATVHSEIHLPFGGLKESGHGGRELGTTAIDFFTEWQTLYVRHG